MFKTHFNLLSTALSILLVSSVAFAIEVEGEKEEKQEVVQNQMKYGIGFQSSFPAYGVSGMYNVNEKSSIQVVLGPVGKLKTFAGRVLYRFNRKIFPHKYNVYGYGMVGFWSYTGYGYYHWDAYWGRWRWGEKTETVPGFGAGVGLEYFFEDFLPEVGWNLEIGFGIVDFKEVRYDFSTFMFGIGAHYYF